MSMSTTVTGFRTPDDKWKKMKAVYDACEAANMECPPQVSEYFNDTSPDESGVEIDLWKHKAVKEYRGDCGQGLEVELAKLPEGIQILRFTNEW